MLIMSPLRSARVLTLKLPLLLCDSCKKRIRSAKSLIASWKPIDGFCAASGENRVNRKTVKLTYVRAFPQNMASIFGDEK